MSSTSSLNGGGGSSNTSPSKRAPGSNGVSAGASLSERIAALQKANVTPSNSPRRPMAASPAGSSGSPYTGQRSTSDGSALSSHASSMRDKIARFQATAASEAPLIPRSSFGAPAPNPDVLKSSKRPGFPAVKGTGNWGETLRPQLTGGTWLQVGGYGNSQNGTDGDLRPQFTGGTWNTPKYGTGRGGSPLPPPASAPVSGNTSASGPKTLGGGADAFAELDAEAETETTRYYREQREKASAANHSHTSSAEEEMLSEEPNGGLKDLSGVEEALPRFPETPETELKQDLSPQAIAASHSSTSSLSEINIPTLPSAPAETPRETSPTLRSRHDHPGDVSDPLVDVGVHGTTPERLKMLSDRADRIIEDMEARQNTQWRDEPSSAPPAASHRETAIIGQSGADQLPSGSVPDIPDELLFAAGKQRERETTEESSDSSRYSEESARLDEPALPSSAPSGLPQEAFHGRGESITSVASSQQSRTADRDTSLDDGDFTMVSLPSAGASSSTTTHGTSNGLSSLAHDAPTPAPAAAANIGEVKKVATPRKSSQKLRPPGRMMSAAEMDASDDEYEPGWASIITSRPS